MKGKKFYIAERSDLWDAVVWVVKRGDKTPLPLEPSLKIRNHAEEIAKAPLQGFQISAQEIVAWMDGVEPWRWAQSDLDRMREWGRK